MHRAAPVARWVGVALLLALFFWAAPPPDPDFRACPFFWLTGRPCPLCGLTRGLCALVKGHFAEAIHFHALTPLALVLILSLLWKTSWRQPLWTWSLSAFAIYGAYRIALA